MRYADEAVHTIQLPGHGNDQIHIPDFDPGLYEKAIADAAIRQTNRRPLILLGHSTGGCLALGCLLTGEPTPDLLILAGTPAGVIGKDLERWEHHRNNQSPISLSDTARMVSYINRIGHAVQPNSFPVLVLHGSDDTLVTPNADAWDATRFPGMVRHITIPKAGHNLFHGPGSAAALDCVDRAICDLCERPESEDWATVAAIGAIEPRVTDFVATDPRKAWHLARSPAVTRALGNPVRLTPTIATNPFQVNIEVTSRCNLACPHCARSRHRQSGKDMELDTFQYLLDLMPNTFRVVLVGLGEPTLHPRLTEFVSLAARRGHDVGMVTNAMTLEKQLSRSLIVAGLCRLTFSLDSTDDETAAFVRRGSDLDRITQNIQNFQELSGDRIPTAIFSAISCRTVGHLPGLADTVADLGVDAWMLSDMNFDSNQPISLTANWSREHRDVIGRAVNSAFARRLPVLSVRALEELGLRRRYKDFLVTVPAALVHRSAKHSWCLSPWQTLPVDVDGNVTICDCLPGAIIGNLLHDSFSSIWNGEAMQRHRAAMRSEQPPGGCRICPRF